MDKIDFARFNSDEQYAASLLEHHGIEVLMTELKRQSLEIGALPVVQDIFADDKDQIANFYESRGLNLEAAAARAKARMARQQAQSKLKIYNQD